MKLISSNERKYWQFTTKNKMNILQVNTIFSGKGKIKIIAAIILAAFAFTFAHSELGLFDYDGENHSSHDYCLIVKHASSQTVKIVKPDILKLKVEKTAFIETNSILSKPLLYTSQLDTEKFHSLQKTDRLYLFDCTFLI